MMPQLVICSAGAEGVDAAGAAYDEEDDDEEEALVESVDVGVEEEVEVGAGAGVAGAPVDGDDVMVGEDVDGAGAAGAGDCARACAAHSAAAIGTTRIRISMRAGCKVTRGGAEPARLPRGLSSVGPSRGPVKDST